MGYYYCKIKNTWAQTALLKQLNHEGEFAFEHYSEFKGYYGMELSSVEIELLSSYGIEFEKGENLNLRAAKVKKERINLNKASDDADDFISTGFVDHYMDAAEVFSRIQTLAATYPGLCQLITLPHATLGYDGGEPGIAGPSNVIMLRITTTPLLKSKPGLLLICGTHAREWVNPLIAVEFAEQLLQNYSPSSTDPDVIKINRIVEEGDTFIVPVMNPDGFNFSFYDDASWRKNRRPSIISPSCPGVDNNRNYSIFFGEVGSSPNPCSNTHHGDFGFSEQENLNMKFILDNYPNILIGVDSHSQGEKIFRPIATGGTYTSSLPVFPEDETIYTDLENAANAAIQAVSGKTYLTGTTSNHAGTSDEYMFFGHRIFAFDFECALSFQPLLAEALISVQEVTAALRALAVKGLDLDVAATIPTNIAQCIDSTGSMITFGFVDEARANAKRFSDLLSIGDNVAIVSFSDPSPDPFATPIADRAHLELALTNISNPGLYSTVKNSIDAINFGGWTSIGAGLLLAADQLTALDRRAVILLSDGFENRDPLIADALMTFPADLPVYTIALGPAADVGTLSALAMDTGGRFYLSPEVLDLHEIYNEIRADVSDDDLLLNETEESSDDDDDSKNNKPYFVYVEQGAKSLTVSLSYAVDKKKKGSKLTIIDPAGYALDKNDWKFQEKQDQGYQLIRIKRPRPGRWTICTSKTAGRYTISAFVDSPLKMNIDTTIKFRKEYYEINILPNVCFAKKELRNISGNFSLERISYNKNKRYEKNSKIEWAELVPVGTKVNNAFRYENMDVDCKISTSREGDLKNDIRRGLKLRAKKPGTYRVKMLISGQLQDQSPFERSRTVYITIPSKRTRLEKKPDSLSKSQTRK